MFEAIIILAVGYVFLILAIALGVYLGMRWYHKDELKTIEGIACKIKQAGYKISKNKPNGG